MNEIVVVTRCLKIESRLKKMRIFLHFRGYLGGIKINLIISDVEVTNNAIKPGEDYLCYLNVIQIKGGKLMGEIVKVKNIREVYFFQE